MPSFSSDQMIWLFAVLVIGFVLGRLASQRGAERNETYQQEVEEALIRLEPNLREQVKLKLSDKKKIEAVKLVRGSMGLGLKEALAVVNRIEKGE